MAISFSLLLSLMAVTCLRLISASVTLPPSQSPSPSITPPPPPPSRRVSTIHISPPPPPPAGVSATQIPPPPPTLGEIQETQINNIINSLTSGGDFAWWANLLSSADTSAFPLAATLFVPSNDATSHLASAAAAGIRFDPFLIPYHIVPQRLTFSDLQQFTTHTRLPTLLPSKYIVITNNSALNFTIDDSTITQADLFSNAAFAVHGIKRILDYSAYGDGSLFSSQQQGIKPKPALDPPMEKRPGSPGDYTSNDLCSGASCSCSRVSTILSTFCGVVLIQDSLKFTRLGSYNIV